MSNENLFDDANKTPDGEGDTSQPKVVIPDNVKDMIGEGKKYSTLEKALEALGYSQEHIARLEDENRQYKEKAAQAVDSTKLYETVQELLKKERDTHGSASLDVASVEALLDRKLTERESRQVEASNADSVRNALIKKYESKEKAQEIFDARAKELGIDLTRMAKTSPRAALELLGIKGDSTSTASASRGTVNSEALKQTNDGTPPHRKSVMAGATTKDLLEAWRSAAPKTS